MKKRNCTFFFVNKNEANSLTHLFLLLALSLCHNIDDDNNQKGESKQFGHQSKLFSSDHLSSYASYKSQMKVNRSS